MKKKILCTICVRKNSQELKNKNIKKINNKPLVLITIQQAIKSKLFDKIVVNSDSKIIKKICKNKISLFINRKKKLAGNYVSKIEVIKDSLLKSEKEYNCRFDLIVDLDVTSPLRKVSDIKDAVKFFINSNFNNLISGSEAKKNPYFNQIILKKNKVNIVCKPKKRIPSRQLAPKIYDLNASIYIWRRKKLIKSKNLIDSKTGFFEMKTEKSLDIDSELDFKLVKYILENGLNK